MSLPGLIKHTERLLADNSPTVLTSLGVVGTVTTAYLAGTASFKAGRILEQDRTDERLYENNRERNKHRLSLIWKLYIPAVGVGTLTIVCIIGANRIGTRRAAAMAAAYAVSDKAFSEYKHKIIEKFGEGKELAARDEIAQDRIRNNPPVDREIIIAGGGDVLCYESMTGRYFKSDMETLKKAQNDVNYMVLNNFYASLSEFYDKVGLPKTAVSEELGWNSNEMLELEFSTALSPDGKPCISVGFNSLPVRDYHRLL